MEAKNSSPKNWCSLYKDIETEQAFFKTFGKQVRTLLCQTRAISAFVSRALLLFAIAILFEDKPDSQENSN